MASAQQLTLPDGRILSYDLSGPDSKPVVLLANSLSAPFTLWDRVVKVLHDNGFRTLRFDQPGHGKSSAPAGLDTEFETIADDVHFLVTSLRVDKLFAWVGVSMGAATSFYFVTKYPGLVHKVAICDTISSSPKLAGVEDAFGPRAKAAGEAGDMREQVEQTMDRWFGADWIKANPDEAGRARAIMNQTTVEGFQTCCHALRSDRFDIRPLYERVGSGSTRRCWWWAMNEMRDKVETGFRAAGKDNKIELKVIANAGHVPFVDNFEQFTEVILGYLKA
ncbi:SAGA-like transcriptional regulatory complex subunit spt3 [Colletotrichum higginsianum]|nr:SAGA-like transcriptional regulatory complex subunit spt3 [Colletotrichum higginsianum]